MAELAPGTELAGCRIVGVAGRGGMGVVYEAVDLRLDRPVAVKLILADRAQDAEFRARFEREAKLTACIDHPNVIPVYAAGEQDDDPFLVMRLVRGTDLHKLLRAEHRLDPRRAARIVAQVASALDAAHAAGLVHRDVKPANVLLDKRDHVYLTDFGLTRLSGQDTRITESGRWLGTVDFASPEQLRGLGCDARSDVYALGCVLFAALTGTPPLQRATVPAAIQAQLQETPPRASLRGAPPAFDAVLARALAKDPDDRYPSAGDLGRAALAAARGESAAGRERTVARGGAAPGGNAETRVLPASGTVASSPLPESLDTPPPAPGVPSAPDRAAGDEHAADDAPFSRRAPDDPPDREPGRDLVGAAAAGSAAERAGRDRRGADAAPDAPATGATRVAWPAEEHHARAEGAPPTARIHGRRRRVPPRLALAAAAVAGLLVVAVVALAGAGGGAPPPAVEAVTDGEVRDAVSRFSRAYTAEDRTALAHTLTRDVLRVLPDGTTRGRRAVVAQYAQQFRTNATVDYAVSDVQVRGGNAGRAQGTYRVTRRGAPAFGGGFVFGVVKENGAVRIRLLVATPD